MSSPTVAEYLARRLHDAGVRHVFGVPGDYTLALNDALAATGLLEWVGTASELGAGYAADGYARRRGLAALVTTYGVGELSCLGAIAGAYAEHVPIVAITGAPATTAAAAGAPVHHTLADGDFGHFERAYREVTIASEVLTAEGAAAQIDRVIREVRTRLRPGYLSLPMDLVDVPVRPAADHSADRAEGHAAEPVPEAEGPVAAFAEAARRLLGARCSRAPGEATRPVIIAGHLVQRLRAEPALRSLAEAGGLPVVTLVSAKGVLDEDHPAHRGVYLGDLGDAAPRSVVERAPVLITVGAVWSDVVAGLFTHRVDPGATVALDATSATVAGEVFEGVGLRAGLAALTTVLGETGGRHRAGAAGVAPSSSAGAGTDVNDAVGSGTGPGGSRPDPAAAEGPLTQADLWRVLQDWLPTGSTLVTDIGTSFWGAAGITFPPDTVHLAQPLWSAIGYALPATLGAGLAEPERLPVLVTGEGAAMMTAPELGTMAGRLSRAIVVVVDNSGYTIERLLRSPLAAHHDVPRWDWTALARAVSGDPGPLTRHAATASELSAALRDALAAAVSERPRMSVVQVVTGPQDAPPMLQSLAKGVRR